MSVQFIGEKKFKRALRDIKVDSKKMLARGLADMAFDTQEEAVQSIRTSPASGKTYRRRGVLHTASSPGNAPRIDRGTLVQNIITKKEGKGYTTGSRKGAPHGFWLEFGTRKMAKRPWLGPAFDKIVKNINRYFK